MTIIETILKSAEGYPDRPAIVDTDGVVVTYGDLGPVLGTPTEWICHTTGTTGRSKLCRISDGMLRARIARFSSDGHRGIANLRSLFNLVSVASSVGLAIRFHILLSGGVYYTRGTQSIDAAGMLDFCQKHQIEGLAYLPVAGLPFTAAEHPYRFKNIFMVGKPVSQFARERMQDRRGGTVYLNYGATEAGPAIAETTIDVTRKNVGIVGKPASDIAVEIDADGFVRMKGPTVVSEYIDDLEATARFFRGGWFYPGDIGHFEGDLLVIDGRA